MTRLSQSDLEATLGFLGAAGAVTGPDPFPSETLDGLRELVPCESVSYCELDRVEERILFLDGCTQAYQLDDALGLPPEENERIFWRVRHQHPVCAHQDRTGDFSAYKLSDFLTHRQLRRLEIHADWCRLWGFEYELCVGLPAPPRHTKCFMFDARSRDFGERDRLLLDRLRPHLTGLYAAAGERRRAAALALEPDRAGLVVLQTSDRIDFATPVATRLLALYFAGTQDSLLPEPVRAWLRRDAVRLNGNGLPPPATAPLSVERGGRRLTVRRAGRALLLDEEVATLTVREREIVDQLADGRSNAQIAERLTIAPTTVRKHLENIYTKLGVGNRTAAVAATRLGAEHPEQ